MEDLIYESIQIMGHNIYYIPRESIDDIDFVFGESSKARFKHAYLIEAYLTNVEGFAGDGDFFSKFGLEIRDSSNFIISRRSFERIVPSVLRRRPQEGDVLYIPVLRSLMEIKFVEHEVMFHSLGKRMPYVYEMRCEQFRYSNEAIDTGVEEIDMVEEENAYSVKLRLGAGEGNFIEDEVVFQSANGNYNGAYAEAVVRDWNASNNTIDLMQIVGTFRNGVTLLGKKSSVSRTVIFVPSGEEDNAKYSFSDNDEFMDDNTLILDLSEVNVFGIP